MADCSCAVAPPGEAAGSCLGKEELSGSRVEVTGGVNDWPPTRNPASPAAESDWLASVAKPCAPLSVSPHLSERGKQQKCGNPGRARDWSTSVLGLHCWGGNLWSEFLRALFLAAQGSVKRPVTVWKETDVLPGVFFLCGFPVSFSSGENDQEVYRMSTVSPLFVLNYPVPHTGHIQNEEVAQRREAARQEREDFQKLQRQYGLDGSGGYKQQSLRNMEKEVAQGRMVPAEYHKRKAEMMESLAFGIDDGKTQTSGINEALSIYYQNEYKDIKLKSGFLWR
uniref:Uncharacterized protein n=1 Tax=Sphaerodactylus townsendi TaxID=933632 RepID=A0ACB8GDW2_9SAUR